MGALRQARWGGLLHLPVGGWRWPSGYLDSMVRCGDSRISMSYGAIYQELSASGERLEHFYNIFVAYSSS